MNGFKNWETWSVVLWSSSTEHVYRAVCDLVERLARVNTLGPALDASMARRAAQAIYPEGTPDMMDMNVDAAMNRVDWNEVAKAWNEF